PQRIACDTSQKVAIRFGETIKSYIAREDLDQTTLTYIPLALAGWLRYVLAIDDNGNAFECSPDPMLETMQNQLSAVSFGDPASVKGNIDAILTNDTLFGVDLKKVGLADKVEGMLAEMIAGPGAVRATLKKYLG
ncbi:MAG: mannitol dehydrogenase family protein, partial [Clostridia bacterium]|nr:mannitol dehydrogenase family protein [Clostridia bacterium]